VAGAFAVGDRSRRGVTDPGRPYGIARLQIGLLGEGGFDLLSYRGDMTTMTTPRRLYRPRNDRWIAGVCSGLARRFGMSPGVVRLLFVLSLLLPGPQVLIYLALWLIMPNES
jgi:phage shock protein PspC (stress-responsive transcriptional regulator)